MDAVPRRGPSSGRTWSALDGLPRELSAARDTVSVNAGMEKLFPVKGAYVPLRLGAAYEPQGYRDPLQRDGFDYFVLATGTGVNTNSLKFDVALQYRWGSLRNSRDISVVYQVGRAEEFGLPPSPEAQGTDRFQEWRLKASVIYRVTDPGGLFVAPSQLPEAQAAYRDRNQWRTSIH